MASADVYLDASFSNEIENKTELITNSKKFLKKYFKGFKMETNNDEYEYDSSYEEFESNVRLVNLTSLGEIQIEEVVDKVFTLNRTLNQILWNLFVNQVTNSKAVILSDQEPISSLLDHGDFRNSIPIRSRKQIKEYLDGTSRTYVRKNSVKVS